MPVEERKTARFMPPLTAAVMLLCLMCLACERESPALGAQGTPGPGQEDGAGGDECDGHDHGQEDTTAQPEPEGNSHEHDHEGEHIKRKNLPGQCTNIGVEITLKPETVGKIGIRLAEPSVRPRSGVIELTGRVQLNEDMTAHIMPRAQGTISQVFVSLGDEVEEDDVLALLNSTELRAAKAGYLSSKATIDLLEQNLEREKKLYERKVLVELNSVRAQYLSAKATAELLEKNYEREKALYEKKIASEKELVEAETECKKAMIELENAQTQLQLVGLTAGEVEKKDWVPRPENIKATALSKVITEAQKELYEAQKEYEKAKIELQLAEAKLHLLGLDEDEVRDVKTHGDVLAELPVRAPFSGVVVEKHAALGENAGPESELFVLADMDVLWVQADVYEKDILRIAEGMEAAITCAAHRNGNFSGTVSYIHHLFDKCASKCKVRIEVINEDNRLKPGMFVKVALKLEDSGGTDAIYVPKSALQNDGTCCDIVFVEIAPNVFESRKVAMGMESAGEMEILSGIAGGEKVVVEGGFALKSEILKSKLGSG